MAAKRTPASDQQLYLLRHSSGRYYSGMTGIGPRFVSRGDALVFRSREDAAAAYALHWAIGDCELEPMGKAKGRNG